jgi:hypothetical protein
MATPEHTGTSRRLRSAARAERERLLRRLEQHEQRSVRLRTELVERQAAADEIRSQLALLSQIAHEEDDSPFVRQGHHLRAVEPAPEGVPERGYLRGADIRVAAVRLLAARENPSQPIHYAEWFQTFTGAGFGIAGRDPQAVFLTQITRSVLVVHAGERGIYALDLDIPRRLREHLHVLHQELAGLHEGQQTIEQVATVSARRADLTNQVVKVERELEEALVSLGFDPDADSS